MSIPAVISDVSDRLQQQGLFFVDTNIPFKEAKKRFKARFIQRLLSSFGSPTEAAKIAGIQRESVHRLMKELGIERTEGMKHYLKREAVKGILEDVFEAYKTRLHPERVAALYDCVPRLTNDIASELPDEHPSLKEAEHAFEKAFIHKALEKNKGNISATARMIGLRFETLHRKIKALRLL